MGVMMDPEELMARMSRGPRGQRPIPEVAVETLRELHARYDKVPFVAGDIVTFRRGAPVDGRYVGQPHVVLEVLISGQLATPDDPGCRDHVRLAAITPSGDIATVWTECWPLEMWDISKVPAPAQEERS